MDKTQAHQAAYNLIVETVKHGFMTSASGDVKQLAKARAEYLTEMHRVLMEYFESLQVL